MTLTIETKIRFITYDEFKLFIGVIDNILFKTFFSFLYWTGCRKGEAQAITWDDINFKNETIRINKTLTVKTKDSIYKITNTKNRKNRTLDINNELITLLRELKQYYSKFDNFQSNWFVFGGVRHLSQTSIDRARIGYYNDVDSLYPEQKFNRITNHEFRHSHASLLLSNTDVNSEINMHLIADRLGDNEEVVRRVYAHLLPNAKKEVKNFLNSLSNL